jgi:hypothetical protein
MCPSSAMPVSVSAIRLLGKWAQILALSSALGSPVLVQAQRAIEAPKVERSSDDEYRVDRSEGHSVSGTNFVIKELSLGWVVKEELSTRRFGASYSSTLRETAESRLRRLIDVPIDIKGIRLINMIDNSQTADAVQASPLLKDLTVAGTLLNRDEVLAVIRQSAGKVVLFLAHIRHDGSIETGDQFIPIQELADLASASNVPFLAMGCRSANFVPSGYTLEINSLDVVTKLARTLGTAETFGNVLGSLMTGDNGIQLDWKFLAGATEVLRIKLLDIKGEERGAIYIGGIRGWHSTPAPQAARLAYVAVKTGIPYWIWRGGILSCLLIITVCLFELAVVGLGKEILRISSGCLFYLCFVTSLFGVAALVAALGQLASGPSGMIFLIAAMIWLGFCFSRGGIVFQLKEIPKFVVLRRLPFGILGLMVFGFAISAIVA